uniref:Uncharacterized protein n=1 Tax=Wuchereria bancrofti TaxID=6293 RepID=A0A1I8ELL0_WUCBA
MGVCGIQCGCVGETLSHCCHAGIINLSTLKLADIVKFSPNVFICHDDNNAATFRDNLYLSIILLSVSHISLTC